MQISNYFLWLICGIFVLGCARQSTPTGGPKDTIPPVLIKSYPAKGQINFKDNYLELTFSEAVILNNPKEQFLITPSVGKEYKTELRKNKVFIRFEKPLLDSTTYSINFRDGIQDITEKNPARNLKLAFSTGHYIDSLSIAGKVTELLKDKEVKDATVALYQTDTFNIFKHKPVYITRANDKGIFSIENLKPGKYYIYAMEDRNKNLVVDSRSESFGFLADTLDLQQNIKNVKIPIIRLDTRPLKISSARPYNTYFNIKTTKNTTRFTLKGDTTEFFVTSYGEDQANVRVYNTFENIDSIAVRFTATDSINNVTDSLLYLKFTSRQVKPESFIVKPENLQVIGTKGLLRGTIRFSKPLLQINYDSLFYRIDSTQHIPITAADIQWDTLRNILQFEKQFNKSLLTVKPDTAAKKSKPELTKVGVSSTPSDKRMPAPKPINNQYYFAKGSFISIELDTSKLISESVKPSKQEETGIIFIEINTEEPSFILQLLDKNFAVLNSLRNKKKASFEDLPPGDYQLRLVIDRDKNGRWSPGNYFKKIEPEPVMFYKNEKGNTTISLKANWELGPLLIKY